MLPSSYLPAYEDGTDGVFRNSIQNSDAGELPRRKHTTFRTWQKFEIKNKVICFPSDTIVEYIAKTQYSIIGDLLFDSFSQCL
jgi:hypothetical protein